MSDKKEKKIRSYNITVETANKIEFIAGYKGQSLSTCLSRIVDAEYYQLKQIIDNKTQFSIPDFEEMKRGSK